MELNTIKGSQRKSATVTATRLDANEVRRTKHAAVKYAVDHGVDRRFLELWFWRSITEGAVCSTPPHETDTRYFLWLVYIDTYEGFLKILRKV